MAAAPAGEMQQQIPEEVFEALEEVRESALTNMLDYRRVLKEVQSSAWHGAAYYLEQHRDDYMDILNAFGEWSSERDRTGTDDDQGMDTSYT